MRAIDQLDEIQKIQAQADKVPWGVWCLLGSNLLRDQGIDIIGRQISLHEDGDFQTIDEVKESLTWLVEQFGGVALWDVE